MEDKHTKNWNLGELRGGYRYISGDGWGDFAMVVTKLDDDESEHPEGLANAELIAQAPTLLEQNRELKEALKTELSKSINPLEIGRISEEEMSPLKDSIDTSFKGIYNLGYNHALEMVLMAKSLDMTDDEIIKRYKK